MEELPDYPNSNVLNVGMRVLVPCTQYMWQYYVYNVNKIGILREMVRHCMAWHSTKLCVYTVCAFLQRSHKSFDVIIYEYCSGVGKWGGF